MDAWINQIGKKSGYYQKNYALLKDLHDHPAEVGSASLEKEEEFREG